MKLLPYPPEYEAEAESRNAGKNTGGRNEQNEVPQPS